jgi:large subunit ribosomal protein L10
MVKLFADKLKKSDGVFITGFSGLPESDLVEFRKVLDKESAEHRVIKNALFKVISKEAGIQEVEKMDSMLHGSSAFTFGAKDAFAIAKVIVNFKKTHDKLAIKGCIMQGKLLNSEDVENLAKLPSKKELLAQVVSGIAAPLSGFVSVLAGNLRKLVSLLDAIKDKKQNDKQ